MQTSNETKEVDFKRPPIVEVVAGVGFIPISGFTAPYFGLLWRHLGDEFPKAEQHNPILRRDAISNAELGDIPTRCWFLSKSGERLVQAQNNALLFNWRKLEANAHYPEFTSIKPSFLSHLESFVQFSRQHFDTEPSFNRFELTYVNIIPVEDVERHLERPSDVLVDHVREPQNRFLGAPTGFDWTTTYELPNSKGALTARATSAVENQPPKRQLIRLELSAQWNDVTASSNLEDWLEMAHTHIVKGFADITNKDIQQEVWMKK